MPFSPMSFLHLLLESQLPHFIMQNNLVPVLSSPLGSPDPPKLTALLCKDILQDLSSATGNMAGLWTFLSFSSLSLTHVS